MNAICCLMVPLLLTFHAAAQSPAPQNSTPTDKQSAAPSGKTPAQSAALEALKAGVEQFRNGQYEKAIDDFKDARRFDPELLNASLYLATTYSSQYIPGAPSDENREKGELAIAEFRNVLTLDPANLAATDGLGSLEFQMSGSPFNRELFLESKNYFQKHISLKPVNVEPYYWIGVIDWTLAFRADREIRTSHNLPEVGLLSLPAREKYSIEYGATIEEGIDSLKKAISLRPDYDDAMLYLNLLYRRKADVVDNQSDRDALITMADALVEKVKENKTKTADQQAQPQTEPRE
jgi:tetratricopeptide (TPR) repeat protein